MSRPLEDADFPLRAIGNRVYRRTESSPILTATDDEIAADITERLNHAFAFRFMMDAGPLPTIDEDITLAPDKDSEQG